MRERDSWSPGTRGKRDPGSGGGNGGSIKRGLPADSGSKRSAGRRQPGCNQRGIITGGKRVGGS
ncbi:hypothetical protein PUR_45240 [Paenibacillus sp. URB8-2]|nr:hypothetical protein PUR_45240 [Paenibacillus sp. URB8-2]